MNKSALKSTKLITWLSPTAAMIFVSIVNAAAMRVVTSTPRIATSSTAIFAWSVSPELVPINVQAVKVKSVR